MWKLFFFLVGVPIVVSSDRSSIKHVKVHQVKCSFNVWMQFLEKCSIQPDLTENLYSWSMLCHMNIQYCIINWRLRWVEALSFHTVSKWCFVGQSLARGTAWMDMSGTLNARDTFVILLETQGLSQPGQRPRPAGFTPESHTDIICCPDAIE